MTTTLAKPTLVPREAEVMEGLGNGRTLAAVALHLKIREDTAAGYLKQAKQKLGLSDNASVLAVCYVTEAIRCPKLLDPAEVFVLREQRELVPLIARGMATAQMATALGRPIVDIHRDGRDLLDALRARNRVHAIKRACEYQILTAGQVIAWLH